MSFEAVPSDQICYVHCNVCNTILAVSVPHDNLFSFVTVRCGHCASLLSVNMGLQSSNLRSLGYGNMGGSSSRGSSIPMMSPADNEQHQLLTRRPPEKRQRVPSTYNRFIKEEIQRIKANNPAISHREAFSSAAKNWAHLPHRQCGADYNVDKQLKLDDGTAAKAIPKV